MSEQKTVAHEPTAVLSVLEESAVNIDHLAIAVPDLEAAVAWYRDVLGCTVRERRTTHGVKTSMVSAVLEVGSITIVLMQGTTPESQVSRYVEQYGPGTQHIAIEVRNLPQLAERLQAAGLEFSTTVIQGEGIRQIFTARDPHSGMMYEFIERQEEGGHFSDESVRQLFGQLEASDAF